MNKVLLTGRLVKDCELMKTDSGTSVTKNSVAVRRDFKNSNGEYDTDFIDFVAFGTTAEYLASYGKKGNYIELVGRWQVRTYQRKDGSTAYVHEVVVENASTFSTQPRTETAPVEDDIPPFLDDEIDDDLPF